MINHIKLARLSLQKSDVSMSLVKAIMKGLFLGVEFPVYRVEYDNEYYASGRIAAYFVVKSGITYTELLGEMPSDKVMEDHMEINSMYYYETEEKTKRQRGEGRT